MFRLAVGAQVLVAKAARDLVVAVDAGDHEDLLEDLRRLRQRVELCGCRRDGTRKSRAPSGVDLVRIGVSISRKPLRVEVVARRLHDAVAQLEVGSMGGRRRSR